MKRTRARPTAKPITVVTLLLAAGGAGAGDAAAPGGPRQNPYLVPTYSAMTHFDPAQQDSVAVPAPVGIHRIREADSRLVPGGLVNIGFQVFPALEDGTQYALAANSQQVAKIRIDGDRFDLIDLLALPMNSGLVGDAARDVAAEFDSRRSEGELLTYVNQHYHRWLENNTARGGIYNVLAADGTLFVPHFDRIIAVGSVDPRRLSSILEIKYEIDLSKVMGSADALKDAIFGMNMTYDGTLVFVTLGGVLGALKPAPGAQPTTVRFDGETITNSVAIGEDNGVYVVSSRKMRKVMWTGDRFSMDPADGAWESEYDVHDKELGGVTIGKGSGSTPSLMGFGDDEDKLVVITDGTRVMNIVAFWRDDIPDDFKANPDYKSRRIASQMQVNFGNTDRKAAQTEQSVAVAGYGALVVNNTPAETPLPTLLENGLTSGVTRPAPFGVEKFEWDTATNSWKRAWVNVEVANPTTVPVVSTVSRHVYFSQFRDGNWEVSGLDWDTGAYDTRIILGPSQRFNGAWSPISFFADGDIGLGGLFGFMRIETSDFATNRPR